MNIKIFYNNFGNKHSGIKISYVFFKRYFKENFNLRFGRPQIDVCGKCEELGCKVKSPLLNKNAKKAAVAKLMVHKRRAQKFYQEMKALKENTDDSTVVLSFDYLQNLPLPNIPVYEIFYMRQLWVFIFCIHNINKEQSSTYAMKDTGESLPTNLHFFFYYMTNELPPTVKNLILFSDSCGGQNKNHTLIRFFRNLSDN